MATLRNSHFKEDQIWCHTHIHTAQCRLELKNRTSQLRLDYQTGKSGNCPATPDLQAPQNPQVQCV